jgi:hypothetical protein
LGRRLTRCRHRLKSPVGATRTLRVHRMTPMTTFGGPDSKVSLDTVAKLILSLRYDRV